MEQLIEQERIPLKEAAQLLGMSPQGVREHMKRNLFPVPIGFVSNISGNKHQYYIYRKPLYACLETMNNTGRVEPDVKPLKEDDVGELLRVSLKQMIKELMTERSG